MVSTKHARTLADIFANPVRADIRWTDIENLFRALGTAHPIDGIARVTQPQLDAAGNHDIVFNQ